MSDSNTETPKSLVQPDASTAPNRRALKGIVSANGVPDANTKGYSTSGHRFLHIAIDFPSGSVSWRLWHKMRVSEKWAVHTDIPGLDVSPFTEALTFGTIGEQPRHKVIDVHGVDKVYIELISPTGVGTGVDLWVAASNN